MMGAHEGDGNFPRQWQTFRGLLMAATVLTAATVAAAAAAEEARTTSVAQAQQRAFDISAQSLTDALALFGRQSGMQVSADSALIRGVSSPGVSGTMTPEQALTRLLAGTGIAYRLNGNTAMLEKAAATGALILDPVKVEGATGTAEETAVGPVQGYVAKRSAAGTKTDTPIAEVPQTINVVTADQIAATKAQTLRQALAYTPGVISREGADHTADDFTIRGFQASSTVGSIYRDGSKYSVNVYDGQQEPYGLERIEVLKGAASVLFGNAATGGIVNTVTKRPTLEALHEINAEIGSFEHRQISADFGGRLSEDGQWSYRLTALKRDADTFVDHVADDRDYIAPALTWRPDADTTLTVLSHYQKSHSAYVYGLAPEVSILPNALGRVSSATFVGEPDYDHYDSTTVAAGYLFEHAFNDRLTLRNSLRYTQSEVDFPNMWIWGVDSGGNTVSRGAQDREDNAMAVTSDTSLQFRWRTGAVQHTTLAGLDYVEQTQSSRRYDRDAANINLYAPSYGSALGTASPNSYSSKNTATRIGAYAQNQMKVNGKWVVLLGGRQDWSEERSSSYFSDTWISEHADAFTGRAGLVYLADNGLAPFASYSESFEPQTGTDRTGKPFDPTTGTQYEVGLRYQPPGVNAMITGTLYQLTRQNVLTTDPADTNYQTQTGEVRSRGFELEAKAEVTPHINLIGAYAYTDAHVTKSNDASEVGRRAATVPYHQISLWGDYNFGAEGLPEVTAGAGLRFVDSTMPSSGVAGEVPAYTVFDAMMRYDLNDNWRFAVNATNLFDKEYIANCTYGCFFGERRKVIGTLSYRW
mgnify:CR=1 FL=1